MSSQHQRLSKRSEVLRVRSAQYSLISFYPILITINIFNGSLFSSVEVADSVLIVLSLQNYFAGTFFLW